MSFNRDKATFAAGNEASKTTPVKYKKAKKQKAPKQYTHPMMRALHGQVLAVDFKMLPNGKYETTEYWKGLNEATMISLGYTRATDYKTEFKHIFTPVYVRFHGFVQHPCMRTETGAREGGELMEVKTLETASTLYDHFTSTAEQDFLDDMRTRRLSKMTTNQLVFYGMIIAGVVLAGYFFAHGGL